MPQPDPNPLDCYGHGSHTAGTAAGFGVLNDGTTYTGPYNAHTISSHDWNVAPGVAPKADIYAYRVFGCAGSSSVVDLAINQAVADGMDVISMSLGSTFGGTDDPTTVAAQNAVNGGHRRRRLGRQRGRVRLHGRLAEHRPAACSRWPRMDALDCRATPVRS